MKRIHYGFIAILLVGAALLPLLTLLNDPPSRPSAVSLPDPLEKQAFGSPAYAQEPPRPEPRPIKEPQYQFKPRYALAVFGPAEHTRVWLVLDGHTLYVDRNGNGDLTEPGNRLQPAIPKDGSDRIGNRWFPHYDDVFEFELSPVQGQASLRFCLHHWVLAGKFRSPTEEWLEPGWENGTLWRKVGEKAWAQNPVLFSPSYEEAQVCHFDGLVTIGLKGGERQRLRRGPKGSELALYIGTRGRPARKSPFQVFSPLLCEEVPAAAHPVVDIEFPGKEPGYQPIRVRLPLKERC